MSDELDTVAKVGTGAVGGVSVTAMVWLLIKRAIAKGDRDAHKLESDRDARLQHCEKALEAHRELIAVLTTKCAELDTRLAFREGRYGPEPLTMPGVRPSDALQAFRAQKKTEEP